MLRSKSINILPLSIANPQTQRISSYIDTTLKKQYPQTQIRKNNKYDYKKQQQTANTFTKENKNTKSIKNIHKNYNKQQNTKTLINKNNKYSSNSNRSVKDLNKIKHKYMSNSISKLNLKNVHKSIDLPQQSLTFRNKHNTNMEAKKIKSKQKQIKNETNKQFIDSIKITLVDNNNNNHNTSIINNLYPLSPTKYDSPLKQIKQLIDTNIDTFNILNIENNIRNNDANLLKKYGSENKIKKYQYLPGTIHRNQYKYNVDDVINRSKNKYRESRENSYQKFMANTAINKQQSQKVLSNYKTQLQNLKYHYYLSPNIVHKPQSHSRSRSRSRSHSRNQYNCHNKNSSLKNILYNTQKYEGINKIHRQKQSHNRSIERLKYKQQQNYKQIQKLGQRCKNMINVMHDYSGEYRRDIGINIQDRLNENRIGLEVRRREQQYKIGQMEIQIQRQKRIRERSIQKYLQKQRKIQREVQINKRKQLQLQVQKQRQKQISRERQLSIQREKERERQLQIQRERQKQIILRRKQKQILFQKQLENEQQLEAKLLKQKQRRKQLQIELQRQKIKSLQQQTQLTKQKSITKLYRYETPQKASTFLQNTNKNQTKTTKIQSCSCQHQCECNKFMNSLNNSRLKRINNKLQEYIVRNLDSKQNTGRKARIF